MPRVSEATRQYRKQGGADSPGGPFYPGAFYHDCDGLVTFHPLDYVSHKLGGW